MYSIEEAQYYIFFSSEASSSSSGSGFGKQCDKLVISYNRDLFVIMQYLINTWPYYIECIITCLS